MLLSVDKNINPRSIASKNVLLIRTKLEVLVKKKNGKIKIVNINKYLARK